MKGVAAPGVDIVDDAATVDDAVTEAAVGAEVAFEDSDGTGRGGARITCFRRWSGAADPSLFRDQTRILATKQL